MNVTIVKSMDVLYLFIKHPKLNLNEIVQLSGKPKTSVQRIVNAFEEIGFLEKDENGRYSLGLFFLQFGDLVHKRLDINTIASPIMHKLKEEVEETIILTYLQESETVNIASVESEQPIRLYSQIGQKSPLYAGAGSRIILAFLEKEQLETYLSNTKLIKLASNTITNPNELRRVLKKSKEDGYAVSYSEITDLGAGIAAPIFNHRGVPIAGLTISGIDTIFTKEKEPLFIEKVKEAAKEISIKLGYTETLT
ncbi:IclR family transcriptional regulator [Niallia sp. 01092]|uniref:IclR family transcriptional regulator n=1 Tax=unclassified Niallia TaxID=2837522 RepID=UPI003FD19BE6